MVSHKEKERMERTYNEEPAKWVIVLINLPMLIILWLITPFLKVREMILFPKKKKRGGK